MVTGSRELIREMNRRLVLETVINDGPLSRAAISKKLGQHNPLLQLSAHFRCLET